MGQKKKHRKSDDKKVRDKRKQEKYNSGTANRREGSKWVC